MPMPTWSSPDKIAATPALLPYRVRLGGSMLNCGIDLGGGPDEASADVVRIGPLELQ
jgi:hypothetical protein